MTQNWKQPHLVTAFARHGPAARHAVASLPWPNNPPQHNPPPITLSPVPSLAQCACSRVTGNMCTEHELPCRTHSCPHRWERKGAQTKSSLSIIHHPYQASASSRPLPSLGPTRTHSCKPLSRIWNQDQPCKVPFPLLESFKSGTCCRLLTCSLECATHLWMTLGTCAPSH